MTHKFAKYFILAIGALSLAALPALAGTCENGTLGGTYTADDGSNIGYACTLDSGDITLSDFSYTSSAGVAATGVSVNVDNPGVDGYGLDFTAGWSAPPDTNTDVDIKFDVASSGGVAIGDVYIILTAIDNNGGTGSASYTETFCETGVPCSESVEDPGAAQTDSVTLSSPTTSLMITKDLTLFGGSLGVNDSSFGNQYSTVPEPRAISLVLGLGLLAGFAIFKRRQAVQN